jgi:hypothetical protein
MRADDSIRIAENYTINCKIPMQLVFTKSMVVMEKVTDLGFKTLTFFILGNIVLKIFK